jgi:hypothetical protein
MELEFDFDKVKILPYQVFLIMGAGILLLIMFIIQPNKEDHKKAFLELRQCKNIHSRIVKIHRDRSNHNTLTFKMADSTVTGIDADWEKKFIVGDSIAKDKGSVLLKQYRNDRLLETLDYSLLAENIK